MTLRGFRKKFIEKQSVLKHALASGVELHGLIGHD